MAQSYTFPLFVWWLSLWLWLRSAGQPAGQSAGCVRAYGYVYGCVRVRLSEGLGEYLVFIHTESLGHISL